MAEQLTTKLASAGWADFHTEFKIPRPVRKKIRRWVDRLKWPDNHRKHDAREYHVTVLDLDEYDADFAKWARKRVEGKVLAFKSTGIDMFNDFVVVRLECPVWEEIAKDWTEEAERRGLEPHKFPGGPKAHISVGRSHDKKWPRGVPNPNIKFETRTFNIKRNSNFEPTPFKTMLGEEKILEPWEPGFPGKGHIGPEGGRVWKVNSPNDGYPSHSTVFDYVDRIPVKQWREHPTFTVAPDGQMRFHTGENPTASGYDGMQDALALHPGLRPQEEGDAQIPDQGYGHAQNVVDILNKQSAETTPADDLKAWLDSFTPEQETQAPSPYHSNPEEFQPQVVAPVVNTPHIDPPKKPYKPYNWAEEGWEESPMNMTAAADPNWLSEYIDKKGPYVYHYTHPDNLGAMYREGIIPWNAPLHHAPGSSWEGQELEPRDNHVYLTNKKDWEPNYDSGAMSAKLLVDLRKLHPGRLNPDEDAGFTQYPRWRRIPGHDMVDPPESEFDANMRDMNRGQWADSNDLTDPQMTQESLVNHGTVAYRGSVPPEAIVGHQIWSGYDPMTGESYYEKNGQGDLHEYIDDYPYMDDLHMPPLTASIDSHPCPRCGEDADGPICDTCGYDPASGNTDYEKMKNNWYDRAWDSPENQPRPAFPDHPMHWREDHASDVSMISRWHGW